MKKTIVFMAVVLLAFGMVSTVSAADVTFGGDLGYFLTADKDDTDMASNIGKARVKMGVAVDDFNTVNLELRNDEMADDVFNIKFFSMTTDVSGALGIDGVGITTTFGKFEDWFSHWNSATSANRARPVETNWKLGGASTAGNGEIALTFGDITVKAFVMSGNKDAIAAYKFGIESDSLVEGLNFIASYSAYTDADADGKGYIKADAGYEMTAGDISLTFPVAVLNNMETKKTEYAVGVKAGYDMFGVNVGYKGDTYGSDDKDADGKPQKHAILDAELMASVTEEATIYGKVYNDLEADDVFQSVDFGAKYSLGALTLYAGYVSATNSDFATMVCDDDSTGRYGVTGSGAYFASKISF